MCIGWGAIATTPSNNNTPSYHCSELNGVTMYAPVCIGQDAFSLHAIPVSRPHFLFFGPFFCGTKPGRFETSNHSLFHKLGSE